MPARTSKTKGQKRQGRPSFSAIEKLKKEALKNFHELTLLNKEVHVMLCLSDEEKSSERGAEVLSNLNKRMGVAQEIFDIDSEIKEIKSKDEAAESDDELLENLKNKRKEACDKLNDLPAIGLTNKEWKAMKTQFARSNEGSLGRPGIPLEVKIIRAQNIINDLVEEINEMPSTGRSKKPFSVESEYKAEDFNVVKKSKKEATFTVAIKDYTRKLNASLDLIYGELATTVYDDVVQSSLEPKGRPKKDLSLKISEALAEESAAKEHLDSLIEKAESEEERESLEARVASEFAKISLKYKIISEDEAKPIVEAKNTADEILITQASLEAMKAKIEKTESELNEKISMFSSLSEMAMVTVDSVLEKRSAAVEQIIDLEIKARENAVQVSDEEQLASQINSLDSAIEESSKTLDKAEFDRLVDQRAAETTAELTAQLEKYKKEMIAVMSSGDIDMDVVNALSAKIKSTQQRLVA